MSDEKEVVQTEEKELEKKGGLSAEDKELLAKLHTSGLFDRIQALRPEAAALVPRCPDCGSEGHARCNQPLHMRNRTVAHPDEARG